MNKMREPLFNATTEHANSDQKEINVNQLFPLFRKGDGSKDMSRPPGSDIRMLQVCLYN